MKFGSPNGSAGGKFGKADVPAGNRPGAKAKKAAGKVKLGPLMKKRGKPVPTGKIKGL
jgi:hypothetical protein